MATHWVHYRRCGREQKDREKGVYSVGVICPCMPVCMHICAYVCAYVRKRQCECGKSLTESHRTGTWSGKRKRFQDKDSNLFEVLSMYLFCHYVIQSIFER